MAQQILSTNTFTTAKWIVSSDATKGTHTTIAAALASASSGDTIFIRTGTYTENITLVGGVNLAAFSSDGIGNIQTSAPSTNVTIVGTVTVSATGVSTATGIQFKTNGAAAISTTGSNAAILNCINCTVNAVDSTAITLNNVSSALAFIGCVFGSTSTNILFVETTCNALSFERCTFQLSGTSGASTTAVQTIGFNNCDIIGLKISTTGTGNISMTACIWSFGAQTLLTTSGTGNSSIYNSSLNSTSAAAISIGSGTIVNMSDCAITSSNTNAITGAGTLNFGMLSFSASTTVNVTTQNGLQTLVGTSGTFTPTLIGGSTAGSTTYVNQNGYYTRIGNLVYVTANINISAATGTGIVTLGGLPFTIKNQTAGYTNGTIFWNGGASWTFPTGGTSLSVLGTTNTTVLNVWAGGSAVAGGFVSMANAALQVDYSIVYQI